MSPTTTDQRPPLAASRTQRPLGTQLRLVATVAILSCAALTVTGAVLLFFHRDQMLSGSDADAGGGVLRGAIFLFLAVGVVLTAVVAAVTVRSVRTLERRAAAAQDVAFTIAQHLLPTLMHRLENGLSADIDLPAPEGVDDEFGTIVDALTRVSRLASDSAIRIHRERDGFDRFATAAARRALTNTSHPFAVLDELQRGAVTAEVKEKLAGVDRSIVRLRRDLENLLLLANGTIPDPHREPVSIGNIVLDASGEVDQQWRVRKEFGAAGWIVPEAAGAVTHLLAELIDNGIAYTPTRLPVTVRTALTHTGVAFEVEDRGTGLPHELVERLNRRLQENPQFAELAESQFGLFVVGRLGAQLGLTVRLRESIYGGLSAVVLVPDRLLTTQPADDEPPAASITAPIPIPITPAGSPAPPVASPSPLTDRPVPPADGPTPRAESAAAPVAPIETAPDSELTVDGLPLRMPGRSLSPHLRAESVHDPARSGGYAVDHRSAEQIEELFAGFPTREES